MKTRTAIFVGIFAALAMTIKSEAQSVENPKIIWGETTNIMVGNVYVSGNIGHLNLIPASMRAGIGIPDSNGVIVISLHNKITYPAYRAYELVPTNSATSNKPIDVFLPKRGEQFTLTLTDTTGAAVPKTADGLTIGKPDSLKAKTLYFLILQKGGYGYFSSPMWPGIDDPHLERLDPTKYFAIEKPGLYKLTMVQRLYVVDTNAFLEAITLPPVTVNVQVEK